MTTAIVVKKHRNQNRALSAAERYRCLAERCRESAQAADDVRERARLLKLAAAWDCFAKQSAWRADTVAVTASRFLVRQRIMPNPGKSF